ncbi:Possible oxidoreductase [Mucinivorans hirudinis]|uniref:Possible oxidoreductase n=1 Tax=Mucinivorans hirudinis TaxID=1433126 RepID=A0A060RAZ9_9BACT|nr:Possible oxidoreductase [Mucinivorans hirudinis]
MTRFAIIGTNYVTDWFIAGAINDPRFTLTAIYSRVEETALSYGNKCRSLYGSKIGDIEIFTSLEKFAASDCYDAVYLASPNVFHREQAILLMRHGKHVLCEKPMATSLRECELMVGAARENGVVLMEAVKTTLLPNFLSIKDNIHKIGTIRRYFAQYCQYSGRYEAFKAGMVLNAFNAQMAGGALYDLGIYCIYPMVVLFGEPANWIGEQMILHTRVDGQGSAIFRYDGFDGIVMFSKIANSYLPSEIQGENGSIVIERINTFESVKIHYRDGMVEDISRETISDNMYYEAEEFISLVENHSSDSSINSHKNTLIAAKMMDEIRNQNGIYYPCDLELRK